MGAGGVDRSFCSCYIRTACGGIRWMFGHVFDGNAGCHADPGAESAVKDGACVGHFSFFHGENGGLVGIFLAWNWCIRRACNGRETV